MIDTPCDDDDRDDLDESIEDAPLDDDDLAEDFDAALDTALAAAMRDLGRAEAEHEARVFLLGLIDAARQGDTLPIIMERVARRAGWTDAAAFALAEELSR